jgi:hypothetical protein
MQVPFPELTSLQLGSEDHSVTVFFFQFVLAWTRPASAETPAGGGSHFSGSAELTLVRW